MAWAFLRRYRVTGDNFRVRRNLWLHLNAGIDCLCFCLVADGGACQHHGTKANIIRELLVWFVVNAIFLSPMGTSDGQHQSSVFVARVCQDLEHWHWTRCDSVEGLDGKQHADDDEEEANHSRGGDSCGG